MFTFETLQSILGGLTDHSNFCVAYSGGLDSTVLLHAMSLQSSSRVRAIHINHGLHAKSDEWEKHCAQLCEALKIPFLSKRLSLDLSTGESIEALARQERYAVFREALLNNENLLTAHTQNDQAETLLLQLLRGAGPKGLAAMPAKKLFSRGFLLRPLLNIQREALEGYAKKHRLKWVEDESNFETRFSRNYLRKYIFPLLQTRWPDVFGMFSRSAHHCAEVADLLEALADIDLSRVRSEGKLLVRSLLKLPEPRQRNVLRRWMSGQGYVVPNTKQMKEIITHVLLASEDANPVFSWSSGEIRRFQDKLYLLKPMEKFEKALVLPWNLEQPLVLPDGLGTLQVTRVVGAGIRSDIDRNYISVRFREGGERCRPVGRKETHTLKNLFQEWGVPTWLRDRVPLLYWKECLIAVVGYCVCEGYQAEKSEQGLLVLPCHSERSEESPDSKEILRFAQDDNDEWASDDNGE